MDLTRVAPEDRPAAIARNAADSGWYTVRGAGQELGAPPVAVGASDGFVADPERMLDTIVELTRIANELRGWMVRGAPLAYDPPGYDEVSVNFAKAGRLMADRANTFVSTWAHQIEATRDGMQAQLDVYRGVDQDNAGRFT